ncbi:unnamed protein product, partial [Prorocentrum cordatum]
DQNNIAPKVEVGSDWAGHKIGRTGISSGRICLDETAVPACSRTQASPVTFSAGSEIYSMGSGACEGLFVKSFPEELFPGQQVSLQLESGSSAGISYQSRHVLGKLKHVHLRHVFVQGLLREGRLVIHEIPTADNSSDLGTKYLEKSAFEKHRWAVGLRDRDGGDVYEASEVHADTKASSTIGEGECRRGIVVCLGGL